MLKRNLFDEEHLMFRDAVKKFIDKEIVPYILKYASDAQKRRWLPELCTGEKIIAIAMTEPSGGSDLAGMKTRATRDGDHYILNGSKTFITNGINADLVIVACKTDTEKTHCRGDPVDNGH